MTSQVFYRKWRPRSFAELVGQEPVSATLRQAVAQGRIAHAYLFCGPRGTGKTSTARILARALNCLKPKDGDPCNACDLCTAFNQDRFLDLIEVDAASNRRIDEMRDLRERVRYSPSLGRYKVYIIDEAHMLTKEASNAFLKTLEEPPAHVVFVLCTTEPQDLLPTIISRCQRYDFRRLASQAVVSRLQHICQEERIEAEPEALASLARASSGSLRDAENLLEQLAVSHGRVTLADAREMLGLTGGEEALELVRHVLKGDTAAALTAINRAVWAGVDARHLHRQSVELLRGVLVHSYGVGETLDVSAETSQALAALAKAAPTPRVVYVLRKLGEADLRHDSPSPLGLELAAVEACAYEAVPQQTASQPSPAPAAQQSPVRGVAPSVPQRRPAPQQAPPARSAPPAAAPAGASRPQPPRPAAPAPASGPSPAADNPWKQLVNALRQYKGRRFGISGLFNSTRSHRIEGDTLVLEFAHKSHYERLQGELEDPRCRDAIEQTIVKTLGSKHELKLVLLEGNGGSRTTTAQSPMVRAALNLGARIVEEKEADEQAATAPGTAAPGAHGPDGGGVGEPDR
ncbi:MAG: DNA polymerase III subunit gamma/tau [Chloroflexota bacterium]|nr:DNA polymerase III subunit gamma/tau [Chloroflexota bacterium]